MDWIPALMEEAECIRYPFAIKGKQMNKGFFQAPPDLDWNTLSPAWIIFSFKDFAKPKNDPLRVFILSAGIHDHESSHMRLLPHFPASASDSIRLCLNKCHIFWKNFNVIAR